jgi:hypothetical protein
MPGPIEERLSLMKALPVNISPIYSIYRGGGRLTPYLNDLENRPTAARFADEHGTLHRLWVISTPGECDMISGALRPGPLVIADGHHRYETALAYAQAVGGDGDHQSVMSFCVDADDEDLVVFPYHRVLKTTVDFTEIRRRMSERWTVEPIANGTGGAQALDHSSADHPFLLSSKGESILVEVGDSTVVEQVGTRARAWRDLDVVALHEAVLPLVLPEGIDDLRFSKDPDEILRLVEDEGWTAGVLLRPLHPAQVVEVARSGERMPQKASYFWPKALTGLVFRALAGAPGAPLPVVDGQLQLRPGALVGEIQLQSGVAREIVGSIHRLGQLLRRQPGPSSQQPSPLNALEDDVFELRAAESCESLRLKAPHHHQAHAGRRERPALDQSIH